MYGIFSKTRLLGGLLFVGCAIMADAPVVWAYDETIGVDARGDVSGAHAPQGGRMGTFILRPIISAERIYNDNI